MGCNQPHLGLATTRELLDELRARIEMHATGGLDYRTVDGEKFANREPAVDGPVGNLTGCNQPDIQCDPALDAACFMHK